MVFGGRRGRWVALAIWVMFQAGIQLTNNFGWLNTASIALGLVLLPREHARQRQLTMRIRAPMRNRDVARNPGFDR